jgi:hypothetical protein
MAAAIGPLCFGLSRFASSIRDARTTGDAPQPCRDREMAVTFFVNVGLDAVGLMFAPLVVMAPMMPIKRIFDVVVCPDGGARRAPRGWGCIGGLTVLAGVGVALPVAALLTRAAPPTVGRSLDIVVAGMVCGGLVTAATRARGIAPGLLAAGAACATRGLVYTAAPMWRAWYYAVAALVAVMARWTIVITSAAVAAPSPHAVGLSIGWHMVAYVVAGGVGLGELDGWNKTAAFCWILALATGCGGAWVMAPDPEAPDPGPRLPAVRFVPQVCVPPPPPYRIDVVPRESASPPPYEA